MSFEQEDDAVTFAIAEDEPIESEGMAQFIVQSFPQASVIWRREDGESALEAIRNEPPDVLILDIEIPVINGLQVCEILYKEHYDGVILINTAYSKFSYAKRAIALRVFDYMIKPMDTDELYATLQASITEALKRRQERSLESNEKRMAMEVKQYALSLLAKTALGWKETQNFFQIVSKTSSEASLTFIVHFASKVPFSTEEIHFFADRQDWLQSCGFLSASEYSDPSHLLVLIQAHKDINIARSYTSVWLFAVSCIQKALCTFAAISMFRDEELFEFQDYPKLPEIPADFSENLLERIAIPQRTWKRIRKKDADKYRSILNRYLRDRLFDRIGRLQKRILDQYPEESDSVFWELVQIFTEGVLSLWPNASLLQVMETLTKTAPDQWLDSYLSLCSALPQLDSGDAFESMQQWMKESFATEVNLVSAAERMGLDTAYFSRLFKKKTGQNFSDALTEIRMEHAEEMLSENPNYSLEELCKACGFSSKTYFSEVFKKWKGMTITQYLKTMKI